MTLGLLALLVVQALAREPLTPAPDLVLEVMDAAGIGNNGLPLGIRQRDMQAPIDTHHPARGHRGNPALGLQHAWGRGASGPPAQEPGAAAQQRDPPAAAAIRAGLKPPRRGARPPRRLVCHQAAMAREAGSALLAAALAGAGGGAAPDRYPGSGGSGGLARWGGEGRARDAGARL